MQRLRAVRALRDAGFRRVDVLWENFDSRGEGSGVFRRTEHAVAEAWGVWGEKSLYGRKFMGIIRSAFDVDEKGKLAGVFYKVSPKDTVPKAEAVLAAE